MALDPLARVMARMAQIERLLRTRMLERSSVTDGIMTFIRGRLRLLGGAVLEIVGTVIGSGRFDWTGEVLLKGPWRFSGNGAITGDVVAEGKWTQNGSWEFNGPGDIAGDVNVTGDLDLRGDLEVLDDGRIKVGNVLITPGSNGRITVGIGSAQVVIDGATGRIKAGKLTIDPMKGDGAVTFENGAQLYSSVNGQIELVSGDGTKTITVRNGEILLNSTKIVSGLIPLASEGDLEFLQWLGRDTRDGSFKRVDPGMGGPMGGPLEWPFDLSLVTSEFGMRDHPDGTGPRMHEGMDFAPPAGTPIPAAGSGVVDFSGYSEGYGNEVWIDHGMVRGKRVRTHYAHMQAPGVAVGTALGKGAIVGLVGNTGASFGAHLHFEVEVDGVKINPRDFIED